MLQHSTSEKGQGQPEIILEPSYTTMEKQLDSPHHKKTGHEYLLRLRSAYFISFGVPVQICLVTTQSHSFKGIYVVLCIYACILCIHSLVKICF